MAEIVKQQLSLSVTMRQEKTILLLISIGKGRERG